MLCREEVEVLKAKWLLDQQRKASWMGGEYLTGGQQLKVILLCGM